MEAVNDDGLIDPILMDQLINYEVVNCAITEKTQKEACKKALSNLTAQGIATVPRRKTKLGVPYLLKVYEQLKNGKRRMALPSAFKGKISARYGKDMVYSKFWACVDLFIEESKSYIGLPANQIGQIQETMDTSICCETNPEMFEWMLQLKNKFPRYCFNTVIPRDIFEVLEAFNKKTSFNIFDLDLMCNIQSEGQVRKWGRLIGGLAESPSVVHITTSIGHSVTKKKYQQIMPKQLILGLEEENISVSHIIEDQYRDRVIPMRSVIAVLKRKEQHNDKVPDGCP